MWQTGFGGVGKMSFLKKKTFWRVKQFGCVSFKAHISWVTHSASVFSSIPCNFLLLLLLVKMDPLPKKVHQFQLQLSHKF